MNNTCSIEGCSNKHYARKWCEKHYARWRAHGDPHKLNYTARKSPRIEEYLETGVACCKHHGQHSEWKLRKRQNRKSTYRALSCRLCERERTKRWNTANPRAQVEYGKSVRGMAVRLVNGARSRADKNKTPCEIDAEWVEGQYQNQQGCCALTGLPFNLEYKEPGKRRPYAPSLDQKEPGKGYTKENIQLVLWVANDMKRNLPQDEFLKLCKAIAEHNSSTYIMRL